MPSLQNLPQPCQGHTPGDAQTFQTKSLSSLRPQLQVESAWTNSLDSAPSSQLGLRSGLVLSQLPPFICDVPFSLLCPQQPSLRLHWHLPPDSWCCLTSDQAEDGYLFIKRNKPLSKGEGEEPIETHSPALLPCIAAAQKHTATNDMIH